MKKIICSMIMILSLSACDDASKIYEKTKKQAIEVTSNVVQKVDNMGNAVTDYSNQQVDNITNSIKSWIYESLEPAFPWIFLIAFLLFFGSLKMIVPFSNFIAIQIPILIGSYGSIFYLFYKLDLTSFALEATFWFLMPIIVFSLGLYFSRNTLLPKIKAFNDKVLNIESDVEKNR